MWKLKFIIAETKFLNTLIQIQKKENMLKHYSINRIYSILRGAKIHLKKIVYNKDVKRARMH